MNYREGKGTAMAELGEALQERAGTMGHGLRERFDDSRERAKELYRRGKDRAVEAEHRFEGAVGSHPWRALFIAAGVGILLGMFTRRR
jgi:ElaB/YqjD/DUF883 family membrane-anchored ribosome-binding protein